MSRYLQLVCILCGTIYPAWSILIYFAFPQEYDSAIGRSAVGALAWLIYFIGRKNIVQAKASEAMVYAMISIMAIHFYFLCYYAQLSTIYITGALILACSLRALFEKLFYQLLFACISVASTSLLGAFVDSSVSGRVMLIAGTTTIMVVSCVTLIGRLKIAALLRAEHETAVQLAQQIIVEQQKSAESERKRLQEQMEAIQRQVAGKAMLDGVIEALTDMLIVVDGDGNILHTNGVSRNMLGDSLQYTVPLSIKNFLFPYTGGVGPDPAVTVNTVLAGESISADVSLATKDGTLIPVNLFGAPLKVAQADGAKAVFIASDLRAKLAQEREMRRVQAQFIQASKLASLGTLGSGVAHELNNPLTVVRGYAELLRMSKDVAQKDKDLLEKILTAANRIASIVERLRAFADQSTEGRRETVNLNSIVTNGLMILESRIKALGIEVQVQLSDRNLFVNGDANQLESVFHNLILNARDAVTSVEDDRQKIILIKTSLNQATYSAEISVQDNGVGIVDDIRTKIFDPFFTTKDTGSGAGLGLSSGHTIVRDHGGNIDFETEVAKGSTFHMRLPLAT